MADFEDGKDDSALRTIGEVSDALQIKPHVLRYWEQQFSLLTPLKRSGGRRYYRPEDIATVKDIDRLVNKEGYTLKGAESVLRESGKSGAERRSGERRSGDRRTFAKAGDDALNTGLAAHDRRDLTEVISGLKAVRKRLADAIES